MSLGVLLRVFGFVLWSAAAAVVVAEDPVSFSREIQPILADNCYFCHGPDANQRAAGLRLDMQDEAAAVIEPHDAESSELVRRITSDDPDEVMPPPDSNRALSPAEIERLRRWVEQGAAWGVHWSLAPLQKPPIPPSTHAPSGQANPIDRFVAAKLAERGWKPSPEASRSTLIRRVTLDLTGLPPTPEEVESFLHDDDPRAYERLVDRLLSRPSYGERMAWNWLDAARYADSNGYQGDGERTMWPWRDWVIDAFNRNLPYDRFTIDQLAGDLLPDATFEQQLATGFNRNHMINGEGGRIAEENRVDYVMDMTETVGTVWMGLTVNCCRCHDHKFDPLTQRDYFSLFAFFNQTPVDGGGGNPQTPPVLAAPTPQQTQQIEAAQHELDELNSQLQGRAAELAPAQPQWEQQMLAAASAEEPAAAEKASDAKDDPDAQRAALEAALRASSEQRSAEQRELITAAYLQSDAEYARIQQRRNERQQHLAGLSGQVPKVMIMADQAESRPTYLLDRGLYNQPGEEVAADVPASLPPLPEDAPRNRLGLARWLVSDAHPLTARVAVNRFWQQLFGIGLVNTPEDFGVQGEIPLHADLLDYLATDFRESGWDVKRLMRTIVTSHTYRQSSEARHVDDDPDNRWLARGPRFRMPSWMLRDQALAVSGLMNRPLGGQPVNGYQPVGVWEEATFGNKVYRQDSGGALYRRSLYTFWRRIIAPTMFFDTASRQTCSVGIYRTNTPLHALLTFNDVTYVEAARGLATRALAEEISDSDSAATTDAARIDFVFRNLLARPALDAEQQILLKALERSRGEFAANPAAADALLAVGQSPRDATLEPVEYAAWTALCLAALNLDETLTKE